VRHSFSLNVRSYRETADLTLGPSFDIVGQPLDFVGLL